MATELMALISKKVRCPVTIVSTIEAATTLISCEAENRTQLIRLKAFLLIYSRTAKTAFATAIVDTKAEYWKAKDIL